MIKKHKFGIIALVVGAIALTLGILAEHEREQIEEIKELHEKAEGVTFNIKKFSLTVGGKNPEEELPPIPEKSPLLPASWAVGIIGLILAPLSWVKERQKVLSCSAAALCVAGLAWHYVLIAIVIALVIIILGALG